MDKKRKALEKKLDKQWSELVLHFHPKCAYPNCYNGSTSAHHIFSRRYHGTRWFFLNGVALCDYHHTLGKESAHGSPEEFHKLMEKRLGIEDYQFLKEKAHRITKFNLEDLERAKAALDGIDFLFG